MVLGITGAIGSGKSTAADILKNEYGFTLIGTDDLAKEIMHRDEECRKKLSEAFGQEIYAADGTIDRDFYRKLIHTSEENRKISDSIVHPLVWKKVSEIVAARPEESFLVETALPDENFANICDKVILITADRKARADRIMKNRGYSEEYAKAVIDSEKSEEELSRFADLAVDNSKGIEELEENLKKAVESL